MHLPTHILSGWCIGSLFRLNPRQRLFCMFAAVAPDLDGISFLFGQDAWWDIHHKWGHNLLLGIISAALLTTFSGRNAPRKMLAAGVYLAIFHLHLLMDFYGSGFLWPIHYLWPFDAYGWTTPHAWDLNSWQNRLTAGLLLIWTIWIAGRHGYSPIELIVPRLNTIFIASTRRIGIPPRRVSVATGHWSPTAPR
jgi:inner membrane protein